jgi:hypothetical protein
MRPGTYCLASRADAGPRSGNEIPLFATGEPADIEGADPTTVLVRRVKQRVAEWYRLQLQDKIWKDCKDTPLDRGTSALPRGDQRPARRASHRHPRPPAATRAQHSAARPPHDDAFVLVHPKQ